MWLGLLATVHRLNPQARDRAERKFVSLEKWCDASESEIPLALIQIDPERDLLPLPDSFDVILQRMADSGTIFSEGDGSFAACGNDRCTAENQHLLWLGKDAQLISRSDNPDWFTDPEQRSTWKMEGNLFDGAHSADYCTVVGFGPPEQWRYLLEVLGGEPEQLVLQFQQLGVFVTANDALKLLL